MLPSRYKRPMSLGVIITYNMKNLMTTPQSIIFLLSDLTTRITRCIVIILFLLLRLLCYPFCLRLICAIIVSYLFLRLACIFIRKTTWEQDFSYCTELLMLVLKMASRPYYLLKVLY